MTSVSGKTVKDKVALVPGKCTEGTAKFAVPTRALTENFNDLNTGKANNYKAGTVNAADESSKTGVSILQSNDAAVDKNPMEANTKSEEEPSSSKGTSPGVVTLVVLAAVGCVALAVVAISAKKKKMKEKSIDDLARPFGTFSSPVRINSTIAKI
ncbi:Carbohydrate-binding protein [Phytophthora cinnamomi]|uniref:Carbohydrate-binding protein n=1 Tax=Phytophthora cinnamomi TaxID=4785 RepID=UPI00355A648F|nr:Carbohydrate-binding protein [Phytophthora cinnamomi]